MPLSDIFNGDRYTCDKENDTILSVTSGTVSRYKFSTSSYYDFGLRHVVTYSGGGMSVTPFAQTDREVLETMREKLVSLGGHPPELPREAETAANPKRPNGLSL